MATTAAISTQELARIALTIRERTIETSARARIPHLGSCLSCIELLTALYWQELRIDPQEPEAPDRDRFVLSKGHGAPVLFQVLAERGFFPIERLAEFGEAGSVFHEHPQTWLHPRRGSSNRFTGSRFADDPWHGHFATHPRHRQPLLRPFERWRMQ